MDAVMNNIVIIKNNKVIDKIVADVNDVNLINAIVENQNADSFEAVSANHPISLDWFKEDGVWKEPTEFVGWNWNNETLSWVPPTPRPQTIGAWKWSNTELQWVNESSIIQ